MARLIDADKLKKHYAWWQGGTKEMTLDEMKRGFDTIIDLQPTVEPIKHGRWIYDERNGNYYCSECHRRGGVYIDGDDGIELLGNYCGICGAKMDESTMSQVKVDVSIKKPTKRWDTCGLTENSVLVDSGARGEKVDEVEK